MFSLVAASVSASSAGSSTVTGVAGGAEPFWGVCAAAGAVSTSQAVSALAIRNVVFMIVSSTECGLMNTCLVSGAYVNGTVRTVSNVIVTFGSVFNIPSIAFGGVMPKSVISSAI